jgi:hypothetical protein
MKVDLTKYVSVMTQSAHPHVMGDGTVYSLGQSFGLTGAKYALIEFAPAEQRVGQYNQQQKRGKICA